MPRLQRASATRWCILSLNCSVIRVACCILTSDGIAENGSQQCARSPWRWLQTYTGGGSLTPPMSLRVKVPPGGCWGQIYVSTHVMSYGFVPGPEGALGTICHEFLVVGVNSHFSERLAKAQKGSMACPKSWDLSFVESVSMSKFPNLWDAVFSSESEFMPSALVCHKTCTHTDMCTYVCVCINIYMHMYIYICVSDFVCIYLSLYVCIYLSQVESLTH